MLVTPLLPEWTDRVLAHDLRPVIGDLRALFREQEYSRFPVYKDSLDNISGFVFVKDLVALDAADKTTPARWAVDLQDQEAWLDEARAALQTARTVGQRAEAETRIGRALGGSHSGSPGESPEPGSAPAQGT